MAWKRVLEKTSITKPSTFTPSETVGSSRLRRFFMVSNWMVGRCLVSSPLASYGGICAADKESEKSAARIPQTTGARSAGGLSGVAESGRRNPAGFVRIRAIPVFPWLFLKDPEACPEGTSQRHRYMIRKAEKADLHVRRVRNFLDEFYRLFAINMRRLGTPVFPRSLSRI